MEVHEMLCKLAIIQQTKHKQHHNEKFFNSLSTDELAKLSAFATVVSEYADQIAVQKILEGE